MESLRILGILLHKCWLVNKRHWVKTLFGQILLPIVLVVCAWLIFENTTFKPDVVETDSYYDKISSEKLIDNALKQYQRVFIMYSPNNTFTDDLMTNVHACFKNKTYMKKFPTEAKLLDYYRTNSREFKGIAVIFDESIDNSTKHLHYKLQVVRLPEEVLYFPSVEPRFWYLQVSPFVQTQICLGESFVKIKTKGNTHDIPEIYIQEVPYPAYTERLSYVDPAYALSCTFLLTLAFMVPALIETLKTMKEKFVGITVLMSMNCIPNTLNLLSWLISGTLLSTVISVTTTILMFTSIDGIELPFASSGNPLIVFLVLMLHMSHTIAFDLHVSAYVSKALIVMPVVSLLSALAIVFHIYVLEENNFFITPYVGMIFPNVLLYQVINRIYFYESTVGDLQWVNLFGNEDLMIKVECSVGMSMLLSVLGMIFHFTLAIYVNAINPGKYGIGHHPLLFFMNKKPNSDRIENLTYNDVEDKYFEPTSSENLTKQIQIRNLKKSYNISLFNKEKIHALRGISVDFYKGQITSLLGHNGAGKSTLMSILTRITSATDGIILINSKDLQVNACKILNDMGLCAQENMYFPSLTVREQLEFFAMVKRKDKSSLVIKENIEELVRNLKLDSVKDSLPNQLSGDQKRKLCLAMALVGDPSTLILDEPTYGLEPHSKSIVRDLLLVIKKLKGQKTILISTHDMDEADILGDRIAILHDGRLKCYGTSLFLKKIIGGQTSVQVTLFIERWSDPQTILKELPHNEAVINPESAEITLTVPTLKFPQWLRTLEAKKNDLDVAGYSLEHVSLEQVFLKLTEEKTLAHQLHEAITGDEAKMKGVTLQLQFARALFYKKMTYTLKDARTIIIQILMVFVTLLTNTVVQMTREREDRPIMRMDLNMYDRSRILYTSFNTTLGDQYENVSRSLGGNPVKINDRNLEDELMRWAKKDLANYVKHMIAATEINSTTANAFHARRATHSLPISINILWNAIIQNILGTDYSISLSTQKVPEYYGLDNMNVRLNLSTRTSAVSVIFFSSIMAAFVVYPSRERSQGIKHLQMMTGVSGCVYWGTMFLFDLMVSAFFVLLLICGLVGVDYTIGMNFYETDEIVMTAMLLMLFVINVLPLIYAVSFIEARSQNLVKLLTFMPIPLAPLAIALIVRHVTYSMVAVLIIGINTFKEKVCMMVPYVNLIHGYGIFYWNRLKMSRCEKLPNEFYNWLCTDEFKEDYCCGLQCYDSKCRITIPYFDNGAFSLDKNVTYFCTTPILYFGILVVLELRLFPKIIAKLKRRRTVDQSIDDEEVQRQKSEILQQIQRMSNRNAEYFPDSSGDRILLAYEMQKTYKHAKAVSDVSFGIDRGKCFGLFGINRSGKSTILRMLTGEEIADYGEIYMEEKHYKDHENNFRSQIGYCPQRDVTIKCLNAYDHLRLFARLRGIPEKQVDSEVHAWIDRLNLNACAWQPSGTLSSGNNQRLNIAMALIGNPKLVLLDEPTTRMDPGARRSFWNTIKSRQQTGQTFLLASHNMEECAIVCNTMAMMSDGKLMCIGTPKELEQRFGAGYDVQVRINSIKAINQLDQVKKDMRLLLHCLLINENSSYLMYRIAGPGTTWKKVYETMNKVKSKYNCIDDFVVVVRLNT